MVQKPEKHESLWWLTLSPAIWVAHLLASYITVTLWCTKHVGRNGSLNGARIAVLVYTIVAFVAVCVTAYVAYRRHRFGPAAIPHDSDTQDARHSFLGFATFLLSLLSAVGIAYVSLPIAFIRTCR
jgi:hypothetical protein